MKWVPRPPARAPERGIRGAQPPGMQEFGGAALKVPGVRGAQPPGMRGGPGAAPPGIMYIYIYISKKKCMSLAKPLYIGVLSGALLPDRSNCRGGRCPSDLPLAGLQPHRPFCTLFG